MSTRIISINNRSQSKLLSESTWDSVFLGNQTVSDDFMTERADQQQRERDNL